MRIALRVLGILSILLAAIALWLFYGTGGLADTDPLFGDAILATLAGLILALATFTVTLIATASRRQVAWLIGLLATAGIILAGMFGAGYLIPLVVNPPQSLPACQTAAPIAPQCQPTSAQEFLLNLPNMIGMAAPLLIGLFALIYSFRMRDAHVAVPAI